MNGAESLVRTLVSCGVTQCFANPGTSEMHLVQATDAVEDFNASLCLFEGVCTGAADGFARMSGIPATTLLHLGAGLGNGIANLHNCRRAGSPLINLIGDHAIHHVAYDAPLTSNVEEVAKPVSSWIRTAQSAHGLAQDGLDAVNEARIIKPVPFGNISTLIIPADCAWSEGVERSGSESLKSYKPFSEDQVRACVSAIGANSMLMLDGNALTRKGLEVAGAIAEKTGCKLYTPTFPASVDCGPDLPEVARLPYFPEMVLATLERFENLVLVGSSEPVSFFAYQKMPSYLVPENCNVLKVSERHEDGAGALEFLADELGAKSFKGSPAERPELPTDRLGARSIAQAVAALAPEDCIVSVDSGGGGAAYDVLKGCVSHTWLNLTGGSIGGGGPVALGAAIAEPDRRTFALLGDGGAMYTIQYLWSAAREKSNLTTVIYSNDQYNILEVEYFRLGNNEVGERAASLFDLGNPSINWVSLSEGFGVPARRVTTTDELNEALEHSINTDGPYLIEAKI